MEFDLEYSIKEFREEQKELFDEDGYRYRGVCMSDRQAEQMLTLINNLESALIKVDTDNATAILPDVMGNEAQCMLKTVCNYEKCNFKECKDFEIEESEVTVCNYVPDGFRPPCYMNKLMKCETCRFNAN
jgi:hypothetical protein